MAFLLCIETTSTNCSVALFNNTNLLFLKEDNNNQYSHAERLHVYIETVLQQTKVLKEQLDAIVISEGPGSYTGLRIGVSAAKGLCFALDIPLISVPTLESLANQVKHTDGDIIAMIDARRMEVFSAIFSESKEQIRKTEAEILNENSFQDILAKKKVYFIGSGVEKFRNMVAHSNAVFIENKLPSAKEMGVIASKKYKKSNIEDVAYFEPFYLKAFKAY
ncbi:MAG: tRNA (adenosine(37)-N6)-threonylcarbamoyltransferase complex dimerization subunit type 1 TsaB [Flavobacteriales bacterium]